MLHYGKLEKIIWNDGYTDYEITLEDFFKRIKNGDDRHQTITAKISYVTEFGDRSTFDIKHSIAHWTFYSYLFFHKNT